MLIVDDHEVFRASARALLQAGGFDVIGEAAGGMDAIEAVSTLHPEIVVLDIQLPDLVSPATVSGHEWGARRQAGWA